MDPKIERLKQRFYQVFSDSGRHTTVTKAPGRVSLMGDHTDLHEGLVLSVNFPQEVTVVAQPRADGMLGMYNLEVEERIQVPVHNLRYVPGDGWANYPKGVIWSLENAGQKLEGLNILFEGKLPQGVGLASSSALGAAVALAAASLDGFQMDSKGMAKVLQRAENQFVHAHSGVSDALSILAARTGNALYTDCRSLESEQVSLAFEGAMLVVLDSGIARSLKTGDHAKRLEECKEAFKLL